MVITLTQRNLDNYKFLIMLRSAKKLVLSAAVLFLTAFAAVDANAQAEAGLGRVYSNAGASEAASRMRAGLGASLQKAVERSKANKAKAKPAAGSAKSRTATRTATVRTKTPARTTTLPEPTYFKPDAKINVAKAVADELGSNKAEKDALLVLFTATKVAFESEVAAKGRQNNLSAAVTFFIVATSTVYHDTPEPSDETVEQLWDGLNMVLDENDAVAAMSDADKQQVYETLIVFSGLVYAGYLEGKQSGNQQTAAVYRQLAGTLIETVLQTSPDKLKFGANGLAMGG